MKNNMKEDLEILEELVSIKQASVVKSIRSDYIEVNMRVDNEQLNVMIHGLKQNKNNELTLKLVRVEGVSTFEDDNLLEWLYFCPNCNDLHNIDEPLLTFFEENIGKLLHSKDRYVN